MDVGTRSTEGAHSQDRCRQSGPAARGVIRLASITVLGLGGGAFLQVQLLPFLWLYLTGLLVVSGLAVGARSAVFKAVCVNLCAALFVLAAFEVYLWYVTPNKEHHYCCDDAYMIRDDTLGMRPKKNITISHVKTINSSPIYETEYTIDQHGLRVAPPYDRKTNKGAVLFFGCSFTIGEGVRDTETMPYMTGLLSGQRYAIYNFGFHGYGPQQMLAAFEHGLVKDIVTVEPNYIIYQAIPYHIERVAGLMSWFPHAPRYRSVGNGRVVAAGNFDTVTDESRYSTVERFWRTRGALGQALSAALRKSHIYNIAVSPFRKVSPDDADLFLDMIRQARDTASEQYVGSKFHVILWDNMFTQGNFLPLLPQILDGLRSRDIRVHLISQIIPDYESSHPNVKYELHQNDSHPNAYTHRLIAQYIARNILQTE